MRPDVTKPRNNVAWAGARLARQRHIERAEANDATVARRDGVSHPCYRDD